MTTDRPDQLDRELNPGLMSDEEIAAQERVANREAMLAARAIEAPEPGKRS